MKLTLVSFVVGPEPFMGKTLSFSMVLGKRGFMRPFRAILRHRRTILFEVSLGGGNVRSMEEIPFNKNHNSFW